MVRENMVIVKIHNNSMNEDSPQVGFCYLLISLYVFVFLLTTFRYGNIFFNKMYTINISN